MEAETLATTSEPAPPPADVELVAKTETIIEAPAPVRVVVTGSPYGGQPERAQLASRELAGAVVRHTDDTIPLGWGPDSEEVARWFDAPGPWVVEGVTSARALRKWLASHPDRASRPCDVVVVLERAQTVLTVRQEGMRKAIASVLEEVRAELTARGVEIRTE